VVTQSTADDDQIPGDDGYGDVPGNQPRGREAEKGDGHQSLVGYRVERRTQTRERIQFTGGKPVQGVSDPRQEPDCQREAVLLIKNKQAERQRQ